MYKLFQQKARQFHKHMYNKSGTSNTLQTVCTVLPPKNRKLRKISANNPDFQYVPEKHVHSSNKYKQVTNMLHQTQTTHLETSETFQEIYLQALPNTRESSKTFQTLQAFPICRANYRLFQKNPRHSRTLKKHPCETAPEEST